MDEKEITPEEAQGIAAGLADVAAGRTKPLSQVKAELAAKEITSKEKVPFECPADQPECKYPRCIDTASLEFAIRCVRARSNAAKLPVVEDRSGQEPQIADQAKITMSFDAPLPASEGQPIVATSVVNLPQPALPAVGVELPPLDITQEDEGSALEWSYRNRVDTLPHGIRAPLLVGIAARAARERQLLTALRQLEEMRQQLEERNNRGTGFAYVPKAQYDAKVAMLESQLAEMTKNRDQWERNAAAENKRAGDALVELAGLRGENERRKANQNEQHMALSTRNSQLEQIENEIEELKDKHDAKLGWWAEEYKKLEAKLEQIGEMLEKPKLKAIRVGDAREELAAYFYPKSNVDALLAKVGEKARE